MSIFTVPSGPPGTTGAPGSAGTPGTPGTPGAPGGGGGAPVRAVEGLVVEHSSSSLMSVTPGSCRNDADAADMVLAADQNVSVLLVHSGADGLAVLNGLDEKGLDNLSASPITCSQTTQVIACSGSVLAHLIEHALTGTMSTTGATLNGVGTKFLSELSVGDAMGNSTVGWTRVTAIASDTVATLLFSLAMGGGSSATVIHNPTIQPNNAARDQIDLISAAGTTVNVATSIVHASGSPLTIGVAAADTWLAVWLIDDGVTPGLLLSTQHETLLAPPAGYTSFRRIGWAYAEASGGTLREIFYEDGGIKRRAVYEMASQPIQVTTANSNAAWADAIFDTVAPRTSRRLELRTVGDNSAGAGQSRTFFRSRNAGDATVDRGRRLEMAAGDAQEQDTMIVPCDGAQAAQYGMDNADMTISIMLVGYIDTL